ncbi:MAG: DUF2267 domain-containing protein [Myxococcota bacterium]
MPAMGLEVFDRTIHLTNEWLLEIMTDLGTNERVHAWHALHAVTSTLRDRMPITEVAHLAAQLPLLVRGLFYEGWRPGAPATYRTRKDFLNRVQDQLDGRAPVDAERACRAVFSALLRHVTPGELEDVRAVLPAELKALLEPVSA